MVRPACSVPSTPSEPLSPCSPTWANVDAPGAEHQHEEVRGRSRLTPQLQLPKNRSTGNLAIVPESSVDRSRARMSFDVGSSISNEYDSITRLVTPHLPFRDDMALEA